MKFLPLLVVSVYTAVGWADTVTLAGRPPFRNVQVVGFRDAVLVFRGAAGELLRIPIAEVAAVEIDSLARFSDAERSAATGDWKSAASLYLQDLEGLEGWRRALILTRALPVLDRAGEFESAVIAYIDLSQLQYPQLVTNVPKNIGPKGAQKNAMARMRLKDAQRSAVSTPLATAFRRLHEEIAIIDDVSEPEPESPNPETGPALLSGRQPVRRTSVKAAPVLRADSAVFEAARKFLDAGDVIEARRILDRALPLLDAPDCGNSRVKLLQGRCRIEAGDPAAAAAELLAIAESGESDAAVEALYYVAVAHRKLERSDVAIRTLQRLLDDPRCSAVWRERAALLLAELEAGASGGTVPEK